jgi:hypothetical protein
MIHQTRKVHLTTHHKFHHPFWMYAELYRTQFERQRTNTALVEI